MVIRFMRIYMFHVCQIGRRSDIAYLASRLQHHVHLATCVSQNEECTDYLYPIPPVSTYPLHWAPIEVGVDTAAPCLIRYKKRWHASKTNFWQSRPTNTGYRSFFLAQPGLFFVQGLKAAVHATTQTARSKKRIQEMKTRQQS